MKYLFRTLLFVFACYVTLHETVLAQEFTLVAPQTEAIIYIAKNEPDYLHLAVKDLVNDVKKISGRELQVVHSFSDKAKNMVVVGTENNARNKSLWVKLGFDGCHLKGKWESYCLQSIRKGENNVLMIVGSDERGTMFGLYRFIKDYLEVDPFYLWSGNEPKHRETLQWDKIEMSADEPSFRFRGWFINDEDLLTEWENGGGARNINYPFYSQVVTPNVMQRVVEALVRSGYNLIIPASFIDILNPAEARLVEEAVRRGVFVSQHHVEPVGVSAFSFFNYWKAKGEDYKFSYFSSKAQLMEVWETYIRKWASYPNVIWQIGLRGIADRPMWSADENVPQSDAERGKIISDAMAAQIQLIRKYDKRKTPLITTTLWAEGSFLNDKRFLTIPENVTVVFADNSPGWKWQADFYSTVHQSQNTYGVYYHHALWGSGPHLAQVVPPQKTFDLLQDAYKHQSNHFAIFNVSSVREFVMGIEATSQMLWDINAFSPEPFLKKWVESRFSVFQEEIIQLYNAYFASFAIHPAQKVPLFMDGQIFSKGSGMLRTIEDKIKNPGKYAEKKAAGAPPTSNDAFWLALSSMHPQSAGNMEMLQLLYPQKSGFEWTDIYAQPLMRQLPADQSQLLYDNLIYPNALMIQLCIWLENIMLADEAVNAGNKEACISRLEKALGVFPEMDALIERYCYGIWKEWYRGDKKMNIPAKTALTRQVLETAKTGWK